MSRRFELGMSLDYCSNWGITEAVREFFQNAKDEEIVNPDNKMYFNYENGVLTVGNKLSRLSTKTLLMGVSSKRGDSKVIGKHGEGYKVATVVLMRNGITVKVYNNEEKEIWTSRIVKSRRYNTEIVVFDVEKKIFKKDYDLIFELSGITEDQYKDIVRSNLYLQDDLGEFKESGAGRVLLDPRYAGNVYVNGLFVCHKEKFKWGYDFSPELIELDRDRGLVDSFDLKFAIGKMMSRLRDVDFIGKNLNVFDLEYCHLYLDNSSSKEVSDIGKIAYDQFVHEYGDDAYPVSSVDEFNRVTKEGVRAILVSENVKKFTRGYFDMKSMLSLDVRFENWYEKARYALTEELREEIKKLWYEKN